MVSEPSKGRNRAWLVASLDLISPGDAMANVLLIDDDDGVRRVLRQFLEFARHTVTEADGGRAGLALFQFHPFDLVITDIVMPKGEGLEAIHKMRALNPQTPIIAISGVAARTDVLKFAKDAGADLVLEKPIGLQDLITATKRVLPA